MIPKPRTRRRRTLGLALSLLGLTPWVRARDMALFPTNDWVWRVSPVLGPHSLEGDLVVENESQAVRAPLSEALDAVSFDFNVRVEGRRGRLGILGDLGYTRLDADRVEGSTTTQASVDLWFGDAALGWGIGPWNLGEGSLGLEARAGIRAMRFSGQLERTPGVSNEADRAWVEPLIGARLVGSFPVRWRIELEGDASGFGVGSGSELTQRFVGTAHFRLDPVIEVFGGYRWMDLRSEEQSGENRTELDVRSAGPVVGLTFLMEG